jgi:alpha-tubulin suppressor-like RCC1 family protein/chitodextrinase
MQLWIRNSLAGLIMAFTLAVFTVDANAANRVVLGNPDQAPLSISTDPEIVTNLQSLRQQAESKGTTRIIVGVRTAFAPEGKLSAANVKQQRNEISKKHAAILGKYPSLKNRPGKARQFSTIPFMAVEVDATELESLVGDAEITSIQEDQLMSPTLAQSVPLIGGTTAWSNGYTGAGQTVAIVDTGVDKLHPFLSGKVISEACYSSINATYSATPLCPGGVIESTLIDAAMPYGGSCPAGKCDHGTHVAGIATGNGTSFSGVAKDASVIAIQVFSRFDSTTYCATSPCVLAFTSDMILGLERVYALRNTYSIASVNMSIGGGGYSSQSSCDADNLPMKAAIDNLRSANIATVIASGNSSFTTQIASPGCISSAVSVGATTKTDVVDYYSNSASFLNLLAPGSDIYSSIPGGSYAIKSGTSMATPHVAGAWALLKQQNPNITVTDALAALSATGVQITDTRNGISKPRIQIDAALNSLNTTPPTLGYSTEAGYVTSGLNPSIGSASTTFTYKVIYTDTNNIPPSSIRVCIDTICHAMSKDTGAADPALRDNSYTNGEQYVYTTTLAAGVHNYYFNAAHGVASASLPAAGNLIGATVSDLTIMTTTLPNGVVGTPYSATLLATGGSVPYSWSISGLPAGLGLDYATGAINGTPTVTGAFGFMVNVSDTTNVQYSKALSINIPDVVAPTVPTGLIATSVSATQINLSWTASTDNIGVTGYKVYRNGVLLATLGNVISYSNTGLASGVAYSYTVTACDAAGNCSAQSAAALVTTPDNVAPSVPAGLTATASSANQIDLVWTASTDNVGVTSYKIYRGGTLLVSLGNVTNYNDTDVTSNVTYSYTVAACDAAGNCSVQSTAASAITPDNVAPSVPTGLTATVIYATRINLTWTASTDNVGVTSYRVYRDSIQVGAPTSINYTDTGLAPLTSYSYTVAACDAAGNCSAQSTSTSATTPAPDTTPPTVPSGLAATTLSANQNSLTWTASIDDVAVTSYKVYRNGIQVASSTGMLFIDSNLSASTTYTYTVSACDEAQNCSQISTPAAATTLANTAMLTSGGYYHSVALHANGKVLTWGDNSWGGLGDGTKTNRNFPIIVPGLSGVVAISGGSYSSFAIMSDKTVMAWGSNSWGQLGDGSTTDRTSPVAVSALTSVVALKAGSSHTIALKSDGTVWAWGMNSNGELGNGTTASRSIPAAVPGLTSIVAVAAGGGHTLTLKSDGTVLAWGKNDFGQLGDGSTTTRLVPTPVAGLTGVIAIATGAYSSAVLKNDGTVWTWGKNDLGQLGDGTTVSRSFPSAVPGLSGVVSISTGTYHTLALKSDGTLVAWGYNGFGQLGDGSTINRLTPVAMPAISGLISVGASYGHTIALKNDGSVLAWGYNYVGQLGNGTNVTSYQPVSTSGVGGFGLLNLLDTQAPIMPDGLTATALSPSQIDLSWAASTDNIGVTSYKVYRNGTLLTTLGNVTSYSNTGLAPSTTYGYTVVGCDGSGNCSAQSVTASATTPADTTAPSVPTVLMATAISATQINLLWNYSTDNIGVTSYQVYRNGTLLVTLGSVTSYSNTGLASGVTYIYTVAACDGSGNCSAQSVTASATTLDNIAPSVPTGLTAIAVSGTQIDLAWTASTDNVGVTNYKLYRNGSLLGSLGNVTNYSNTGLSSNVIYSYTVAACDAAGNCSAQSAAATATTPADTTPPSVPGGLIATPAGASQINLSWTASTDNIGVNSYKIYRNSVLVGTTSSTGYSDTGLTASTTYSYRVTACDAAGNCSAQSTAASATTPSIPVFPPNGVMPVGWVTSPGANAGWVVASDAAYEGSLSLKSGVIGHSQTASVEVTGAYLAGTVSFARKVSSELNYDYLRFYIDGIQQASWSGEQAWAVVSYTVSAGTHTFRWSYTKDGSVVAGSDAAWIDSVSLPISSDTTAPTVPAGLTATAITSSQINLSWTASTDNVGVAAYKVYRDGTLLVTLGNVTSYSNLGLAASTTFSYTVSACDTANNCSAQTGATSATTFAPDTTSPTVPTGLIASASSASQINLSWAASTDNVSVTAYKVYRGGTPLVTLGNVTSYSNTGLTSATTYSYTVAACDAAGNCSAQSIVASAKTLDNVAPTVPAGLTASAVSATQVNLSWTVSTDNVGVTSYKVYRGGTLLTTLGNYTSIGITGLTSATTYTFTVTACDAAGNCSAQSTAASATTLDNIAPWTPSGLNASAVSASQINLSWTASTDNVGVTSYKVYRGGTLLATQGNVTSYSDTGLTSATTYSYTVTACDAAGNCSIQSSTASATTLDNVAPTIPTGLIANAVSASMINLSWFASTDNVGVTSYKVYRNGIQVGTVTGTSFTDAGLISGATYSYAVSACDAAGNCSGLTLPVSATTLDNLPPSVPSGLNIVSVSATQINLSWIASSDNVGVTGYVVYRDGIQIGMLAETSFIDAGLTSAITYTYAVAACDAAGNCSAPSASLSATTLDITAPTVPAGLTASAAKANQINLSWTASSDNVAVTGYMVNRNGVLVGTPTGTTFIDTGLNSESAYSYTVAACDASGNCSAPSDTVSNTTLKEANPGALESWGYNAFGQATVPAGLSGIVAVAAGFGHTVALKSDGSLVAWGYNVFGQTTAPANLGVVQGIAAGNMHTVALKTDGTVAAWGDNTYGQTTVPAGLSGVVAIAANSIATLALKNDGTVVAWGDNTNDLTVVPAGLSGVVAIAAGNNHSVALKNDGTVVAWGDNGLGQTTVPAGLNGVVAIAAGIYHTVALKNDGTVVVWGYNSNGQTLVPAGLNGVTAIAAGSLHTVALKGDGSVVAWGDNSFGQLMVPAGMSGVTSIAAGTYHTVALGEIIIDATPPVITASVLGGTYGVTQSVTLSADEPATIYFTLDGSTPTTSSAVYSTPIIISTSTTLKYFGKDAAGNASAVQAQTYVIDTVAPVITPSVLGGTFGSTQTVTLSADETATIYYTLDGTTLTVASTVYITPIAITASTTLKYFGKDAVGNVSVVQTQSYVIDTVAPVVTPSVMGGTYGTTQTVTLSADETATIYYTLDGTAPTVASTVYTAPIVISTSATLKYFGKDAVGNASVVQTQDYVIDMIAPVITPSVIGGTYGTTQTVTLNADETASVYFTLDGTTPTAVSAIYTTPILISTSATLKYFGKDTVGNASAVQTQSYVIDSIAPVITPSVLGGTFGVAQTISLNADETATIYYTQDGTIPTAASTIYTTPIAVNTTTTLKYFGMDTVGNASAVQIQNYVIDTVAPVITPSILGGTYGSTQTVALSADETATIFFTLDDGSTSTVPVRLYTAPFVISTSTTVKYYGKDTAGNASVWQTQIYVMDTVAPVITPSVSSGTYGVAQTVTLSADETATLYFTLDGSSPTAASTVYTAPIVITASTTLKYFGKDAVGNASAVQMQDYVIDTVAPVITPSVLSGTYGVSQTVALSADETATIYYTQDGTTPTAASTVYTTPIVISTSATLKYFGKDAVGNASAVQTQSYVIDTIAPLVTSSVLGGTYGTTQTATLSADETTTLYYTLDGTTPTAASTVYTTPIVISTSTTLKYFGKDTVGNASEVQTQSYVIDTVAPVVTSSVLGGTYGAAQLVTLSANETSTIYYTLDGSTPTAASTVYTTPLAISTSATLKYFGKDAAGNASAIQIQTYVIDSIAPVVTSSVAGGGYNAAQAVTLSANEAATIYYTLDGTIPTAVSTVYTAPIVISTSTTLKYFGMDAVGNTSVVQTQNYVIDSVAPVVTSSVPGGSYSTIQSVTLSVNEPATIYYTLDGTTPTTTSLVYTSAIAINATATLKYFGRDVVGNTSAVQTQSYTISGVDLVMTALSTSTTTISAGSSFSLSNTEKNIGTTAMTVNSNTINFYLSTDANVTSADTLIGSRSVNTKLASGTSSSSNRTVTVPSTLSPGTYYIGAIADATNRQAETNENNNAMVGETIVVR